MDADTEMQAGHRHRRRSETNGRKLGGRCFWEEGQQLWHRMPGGRGNETETILVHSVFGFLAQSNFRKRRDAAGLSGFKTEGVMSR